MSSDGCPSVISLAIGGRLVLEENASYKFRCDDLSNKLPGSEKWLDYYVCGIH